MGTPRKHFFVEKLTKPVNDLPGQMVEGQTFTIEPILSMGSIDCDMWDDGWTAVTTDGSLAAQFEHTILINRTGAEILTKC
nr:unnamed protein product [Digitaria exilis]